MSDFNLGTARGSIEIDSSGAEVGVDRATKSVAGFGQGLDKAAAGMTRAGLVMGGVGVAAVAGFGVAINAAANFEQRISAIGAVSNASSQDLEKFRKLAIQLGQDTKFSAGQAATAIEELAKAGISIPDILQGAAKAVTDLAAAGEVDLTRSAEITANAMNAFGIAGKDASRVADVFAVAANSSAADVDTLGISLAQVSAVAATVGLGFEDTIAALELFANKGLQGSDAGTSLKTALLNLQPTTEKQVNLFKELGLLTDETGIKIKRLGGETITQTDLFDKLSRVVGDKAEKKLAAVGITLDMTTRQFTNGKGRVLSFNEVTDILARKLPLTQKQMGALGIEVSKGGNAFFDAQGKLRPLVEIQGALQRATAGMTDAQKLATFETIGGSDAVRALSIISGDATGQLAGLRGELTSQGQAGDTAKKKMDNLKGSMEQLRGSLETALIRIGQLGQGPVRIVVDFLTNLVNGFINLSPGIQQAVIFGALFLGILTGMAGMFLLVGGGILKIIKTFRELKLALQIFKDMQLVSRAMTALNASFLTNPVFLIIAGLVALGVALFIAYKKSETFRNIVDSIGRAVASVFGFLLNIGKQIVGFFVNNWPLILAVVMPLVGLPLLLIMNWRKIVDFFAGLPGIILGFLGRVLSAVGGFLLELPGMFLRALGFIIGFWIGFQLRLIGLAIELGLKILEAIGGFLSRLPGMIWNFLLEAIGFMIHFVSDMIGKATDLGSRFLNAIVDFFSKLPGRVGGFFSDVIGKAAEMVSKLPGMAKDAALGYFNSFRDGITGLPGVVGDIVGKVIQAFRDMIGRAFDAAKDFASGLWNGFRKGLFGSPHTKIEYAMWAMVKNVNKSVNDLNSAMGNVVSAGNSTITAAAQTYLNGTSGGSSAPVFPVPSVGTSTINFNGPLIDFDGTFGAGTEMDDVEQLLRDIARGELMDAIKYVVERSHAKTGSRSL